MRIGIVGLGLIGGSLAKALKAYTGHEVLVSNRTAATAQAAVEAGDADGLLTDEALSGAEIVSASTRARRSRMFAKRRRCSPRARSWSTARA